MTEPEVKKRKIKGDCGVCCEKYTSKARRQICCSYCDHSTCSSCLEKWIVSQPNDPQCMECRRPFSDDFVRDSVSSTFLRTEYKIHREKLLFEREMAVMPDSQYMVSNYRAHKEVEKEIANRADTIKQLQVTLHELKAEQNASYNIAEELSANHYRGNGVQRIGNGRGAFVRACTRPDCRGFLGANWICGVCDHSICRECCEDKGKVGEDMVHQCNPETVATVKKIMVESKPCPKCGIRISKVDGCDQMWCSNPTCHVFFSWNTGKLIESGPRHNPEYYRYVLYDY